MILPGQGNGKAVRVCLQCFDAASKVKATSRPLTDDNKDQRNSADSSGGDSSGDDDDDVNKESSHDEVRWLNLPHSHTMWSNSVTVCCFSAEILFESRPMSMKSKNTLINKWKWIRTIIAGLGLFYTAYSDLG